MGVEYVQHRCPCCGAPMPPPPATRSQRCAYCAALLAPSGGVWVAAAPEAAEESDIDPALQRLWAGGIRYAVFGRLGRGDATDVFLAQRDARPTERVVIKVLRSPRDEDLAVREQAVLEALESSRAQGASHFARLVPQRVWSGTARLGTTGDGGERRVSIFRWRSGFVHTLADVRDAYPAGIDAGAAVWMWKRLLELLGFVHRSGWVHGAVLPQHALLHARDHGVVLIGWSHAVRAGEPLVTTSASSRALYPAEAWNGAPMSPTADLAMSARVVALLLGGDPERAPESVAPPLARLIEAHARSEPGAEHDAWALRDRLDAVARDVLGPPRFVPFPMPS